MEMKEENLEAKEEAISLDEANKLDALESKFFKPETNITYKMSIKEWKLVKKDVPKYDFERKKTVVDEKGNPVMISQIVLTLVLDSLNGVSVRSDRTPLKMTWDIKSRNCRNAWEPYLRNGQIDKMLFEYTQKGESTDRKYQVVVSGMKPGQKPLNAEAFL